MPHGSDSERAASLAKVQYLCDSLDDCGSIDGHEVLGRYFLNTEACTETTGSDIHYNHYDKQQIDSQQSEASTHSGMEDLIPASDGNDWPFSFDQMLRFVNVRFL